MVYVQNKPIINCWIIITGSCKINYTNYMSRYYWKRPERLNTTFTKAQDQFVTHYFLLPINSPTCFGMTHDPSSGSLLW